MDKYITKHVNEIKQTDKKNRRRRRDSSLILTSSNVDSVKFSGYSLRKIRCFRGMTQKQLGLKLGFPEKAADVRVAQYESGVREPKKQLLTEMANILEVSTEALTPPSFNSLNNIIEALFTLDDTCGLRVNILDNRLCLSLESVDNPSLNGEIIKFMCAWYDKVSALKEGKISKEEYDSWRYNYTFE